MVFAAIRRIGRVFAIILLAWTTIDLIDHNVCAHPSIAVQGAGATTVGQAAPPSSPPATHVDHSFCCSHTVDVKTPFRITLTFAAVGFAPLDDPALLLNDPDDLYHPPLA